MLRTWWPRVGAASGILFVIVLVIGDFVMVLAAPPKTTASPHKIALFYLQHHKGLKMQICLEAGASLLLLAFAVYIAHLIRRAEGEPGVFSRLTIIAGTAAATVNLVWAATQATLQQLVNYGTDGGFNALYDLQKMLIAMLPFPTTLFLGAIGIAALATAFLPRWLGWFTFLLAILQLISGAGQVLASKGFLSVDGRLGLISFLLLLLWFLVTSILLTARAWNAPEAVSAPAV